MRFDKERREASPDLSGDCPVCDSALIPKCGDLRAWHWAHRGLHDCDPWREGETQWHIDWKNRFPAECQEILRRAENGEKHIADVMTPQGRVVEFQHSPIAADERLARESFYGQMVWVVDGLARKRDLRSFENLRFESRRSALLVHGADVECALLRDWKGRRVDVLFDFGVREEDISAFGRPVLWHLRPDGKGREIFTVISVAGFVKAVLDGRPFPRIRLPEPVATPPTRLWRPRPNGFQQYLERQERSRPRF